MKTTGLTANVLANQTAVENGADEAVFVQGSRPCDRKASGRLCPGY